MEHELKSLLSTVKIQSFEDESMINTISTIENLVDSNANAPGASDDLLAVGVLLEALRSVHKSSSESGASSTRGGRRDDSARRHREI